MSDVDRVYVVSFVGEPPERTLREHIETRGDAALADIINAIGVRLARRGRIMEARALFAVERVLYPPPRGRDGQ